MNEMYEMSIVTHYYSVIGMIIVIFINFLMIQMSKDIKKLQVQMSLFAPIGSIFIGGVIFTGVVMMAAKHLEFTVENILMIIFSVVIIILESKRLKTLKHLLMKLDEYKIFSTKILIAELLFTGSISLWMLI